MLRMLDLTYILRLNDLVKKTCLVHSRLLTTPTSTILVCMMHLVMLTTMHASDAGSDLDFTVEWLLSIPVYWQHQHQPYWLNACFRCCLWPTFYVWATLVHSCLLTTPTSTKLVCMMHPGMLNLMHASDAACDLHFTVDWLKSIPARWQYPHQLKAPRSLHRSPGYQSITVCHDMHCLQKMKLETKLW